MTRVGAVTASLYIPAGYVLADGSTKNRADYPRLVNLIEKYNLWKDDTTNDLGKYGKGDNSTTFVLPNLIDRHIKYANSAGGKLEAGLPNIIGGWTQTFPDEWPLGRAWNTWEHLGNWAGALKLDKRNNTPTTGGDVSSDGNGWVDSIFSFDASHSNSIYGASTTVQPPSVQYLPIIRY